MMSLPTHLDAMVATDPRENVQIEVSLERELYNVLVTSEASVESVMSIPMALSRRSSRRAERPLSPISHRSSVFERRSASCPPPLVRQTYDASGRLARADVRRRDSSCPPAQRDLEHKLSPLVYTAPKSRKPNLVAKKRGGLFARGRKNKIVPSVQ